jgi:hypothetical protein
MNPPSVLVAEQQARLLAFERDRDRVVALAEDAVWLADPGVAERLALRTAQAPRRIDVLPDRPLQVSRLAQDRVGAFAFDVGDQIEVAARDAQAVARHADHAFHVVLVLLQRVREDRDVPPLRFADGLDELVDEECGR